METENETRATSSPLTIKESQVVELPKNRFALELEFVQSLASPAYLHFLANNTTAEGVSLLLDTKFKAFLKYLQQTWTRPDYSRYIVYPHALYFLDLLIQSDAFCRELSQVPFRNFCHQQQYYAWQNRFSTLYGVGGQDQHQKVEVNIETSNELAGTSEAVQENRPKTSTNTEKVEK
jgi:mediator of RNA polymerase II transcription subunit 31